MAHSMKGIIALWSGVEADIPFGWHLCDGTNGTPDLRGRFIVGATFGTPPGSTGGDFQHTHTGTADAHFHNIYAGANIAAGTDFNEYTEPDAPNLNIDLSLNLPPFYALCYIMHI